MPAGVFLNDVVPYASLDEKRDAWRREFYEQCRELVVECRTATDATQAINKRYQIPDTHVIRKVGRTAADAIVLPPLLPGMSVERYLEALDWTGRQIRGDKRGHLSGHLRPALERLDLDVERWVENVERYGGLFYRVAGKLRRLREMAGATGRAWLQGHAEARRLYAQTS